MQSSCRAQVGNTFPFCYFMWKLLKIYKFFCGFLRRSAGHGPDYPVTCPVWVLFLWESTQKFPLFDLFRETICGIMSTYRPQIVFPPFLPAFSRAMVKMPNFLSKIVGKKSADSSFPPRFYAIIQIARIRAFELTLSFRKWGFPYARTTFSRRLVRRPARRRL